MKSRKQAFTLVELLVSMAIIAVLLAISVFGISIAQRVLRDNQRRAKVQDIVAALNAHYSVNSVYPVDITVRANQIVVGTQTITLEGPTVAASATTASASAFCYSRANDGYRVGVQLEEGLWFDDLGSSLTGGCNTAHTVAP